MLKNCNLMPVKGRVLKLGYDVVAEETHSPHTFNDTPSLLENIFIVNSYKGILSCPHKILNPQVK
jgi:hypothetical protein